MALQYPLAPYANEIPFWCIFSCAPYSVINTSRTRTYIRSNATQKIYLPFTSEPKMVLEHKFAEGTNPVGPVLSLAGLKNTSGSSPEAQSANFLDRLSAPTAAFYENTFTTDTFRRFSNITEASMTSEARRTFNFKFLFVPKNSTESTAVNNIVNTFRNYSYPQVVPELPERTYPQNLWTIDAASSDQTQNGNLTNSWLGDPLVCVLQSMEVDKGDPNDPVLKILPDGQPVATLMSISFVEFETGTFVPSKGLLSKSEVSAAGRFL